MKPTIGRIVHYVSYGTPGGEFLPEHRAAIVTAVHLDDHGSSGGELQPSLDLCVLNPTGIFFNQRVRYDTTTQPRGGTWHWPERAEE